MSSTAPYLNARVLRSIVAGGCAVGAGARGCWQEKSTIDTYSPARYIFQLQKPMGAVLGTNGKTCAVGSVTALAL